MDKSNLFPSSSNEGVRTLDGDAERIESSAESQESKIYASRKLARFFEVEITLRIFGQVIWHWVFPPQKN